MIVVKLNQVTELVIYKGREIKAPLNGGIKAMFELIARERI